MELKQREVGDSGRGSQRGREDGRSFPRVGRSHRGARPHTPDDRTLKDLALGGRWEVDITQSFP
jgi:hypothetical protein